MLNYTDADNQLYIVGSAGDKLDLNPTGFVDGDLSPDEISPVSQLVGGGQIFNVYAISIGSVTGQLLVDNDIKVTWGGGP